MKFIELNGKKVLLRLLINLSIDSIIALIWYEILKKNNNATDGLPIMLMLVYGFGMAFFLVYYFGGWYYFRVSRKLFAFISSLNIFDNNTSFFGYLSRRSLFYTQECLCGKIDGYPVIISIDIPTGRSGNAKLNCEVITIRFNHANKEQLFIALNWSGYRSKSDVKHEVDNFIKALKSKTVVMGTFESVVADNYLSVIDSNDDVRI